jgi:hypothetical protein
VAIQVLNNAYILINGVDLSDHCSKVTIEDTRETVDITCFGATSKAVTKGLGDAVITLDLFQDFAPAKTHATLSPLINSTTPVSVEVRGTNAVRSPTNPAAVMSGLLMNYNMLDGSVGEASAISAEFVNGSQAGLTYAVA